VIVECGHCGAPLEIEEGATVIACAYCARKNKVAGLKTVAATTPGAFRAPEVSKPAEESADALPSKPRGGRGVAVLAGIALVIAGVALAVHMRGSTVEDVAKLPLDEPPARLEKDFHVTYKTKDSVRITFRPGAAGPYEHLHVRWDDGDFSCVSGLMLFVGEGEKSRPSVIAAVDQALRGGLDKDGRWHWGPASFSVDREKGTISIAVKGTDGTRPNLLRKRQITALWQIARAAAFGAPLPPAEEIRAVLGGGHPLSKLAALDVTTPFAAARTTLPLQFPGSLVDRETELEIALDHPLLRSVTLRWENAAAGRLRGTHFRVTERFRPGMSRFVGCLGKALGPPETRTADFAAGTQSDVFTVAPEAAGNAPGLTVHVGDAADLYLNPVGSEYPPSAWRRTFEALDRCR